MSWFTEGTLAERYERAHLFFDAGDHIGAARILTGIVEEVPESTAALELLARACYHSAQLGRAEHSARVLVEREPDNAYAHLVLGRTLQRQGRRAQAERHLRLAAVMSDYVELDEPRGPRGTGAGDEGSPPPAARPGP